jgi:hypothetical protein
MKTPKYKISKHLVRILNIHLTLNHHYNVVNSTDLINDLTNLKINKIQKLITYKLKDLYVKIPVEETLTLQNQGF